MGRGALRAPGRRRNHTRRSKLAQHGPYCARRPGLGPSSAARWPRARGGVWRVCRAGAKHKGEPGTQSGPAQQSILAEQNRPGRPGSGFTSHPPRSRAFAARRPRAGAPSRLAAGAPSARGRGSAARPRPGRRSPTPRSGGPSRRRPRAPRVPTVGAGRQSSGARSGSAGRRARSAPYLRSGPAAARPPPATTLGAPRGSPWKSPVSATTVVNCLSWSSAFSILCRFTGEPDMAKQRRQRSNPQCPAAPPRPPANRERCGWWARPRRGEAPP